MTRGWRWLGERWQGSREVVKFTRGARWQFRWWQEDRITEEEMIEGQDDEGTSWQGTKMTRVKDDRGPRWQGFKCDRGRQRYGANRTGMAGGKEEKWNGQGWMDIIWGRWRMYEKGQNEQKRMREEKGKEWEDSCQKPCNVGKCREDVGKGRIREKNKVRSGLISPLSPSEYIHG